MIKTRGRRTRRIFSSFIWSIIPVFGVLTVAAYVGLAIDRHVYPPVVPVSGISMNPLLHFGDLVMLKKADLGHLHKGDIIAFRTTADVQQKWGVPGSYVHRIVTVETGAYGQQFQTKGDNVSGKDPFWTVEQNVIGVYAGKISGAGYPILFFRSRQGQILLGGALLILFLYWLLGVFERRRSADEVNVNNLSTIVEEARRITKQMEDITITPRSPPIETSETPATSGTGADQETLRQLVRSISEYGLHLQSHTAVMKGLAATTVELQGATMEMREAISNSPRMQATPASRMPKLKRSLRGYSRKAVQEMYEQLSADIERTQRTVEHLELDNAEIRRDRDRLEQSLVQAHQIQLDLLASLTNTQELLRAAQTTPQASSLHVQDNLESSGKKQSSLIASLATTILNRWARRILS